MKNFRLAGFGKRLVAYLLDGFIIGIIFGIIIVPFIFIFASMGIGAGNWDDGDMSSGEIAAIAASGVGILILILLLIVAPIIYDALMTASSRQATLGKSIMRIKVVKENGEALSIGDAFLRALVKYVTSRMCFLLLIVCLFNKEEQNLHDLAAKTFVIED